MQNVSVARRYARALLDAAGAEADEVLGQLEALLAFLEGQAELHAALKSPTLSRPDPDDIVARYGEGGERLVKLIRDSASILFDTVRAEGIDAEAEQSGWIQPVHTPGRMKIAERRVKQWGKWGAPVTMPRTRRR